MPCFLFKFCTSFLLLLGRVFHCSYEKISVIFNLYLQGFLLITSGFLPFFASCVAMITEPSGYHIVLCCITLLYASIYVVGQYLLLKHYPPRWIPTFNLCMSDLLELGQRLHLSYVVINLLLFVVWWLTIILVNLLLSYFILMKI